MSFVIHLPADDFLEKVVTIVAPQKTAFALDALLTILTGLHDVTQRLEQRILAFSQFDEMPDMRSHRLLVQDVWAALDGMHRACLIAPKVGLTPQGDSVDLIANLARARNSFQHLEDRIEHFFANNGGTVFGNFYWRYRLSAQTEEFGQYFTSGVSFGSSPFTYDTLNLPDATYAAAIGVFDLQVHFLEDSPKGGKAAPLLISVDKVASLVNQIIPGLRSKHRQGMQRAMEENGNVPFTPNGLPPFVIKIFGGGNNPSKATTS